MVNHSPGHISVTHQGEYLPNATNINTPSQQAKTFYITPSMSQKLNYFVPTEARWECLAIYLSVDMYWSYTTPHYIKELHHSTLHQGATSLHTGSRRYTTPHWIKELHHSTLDQWATPLHTESSLRWSPARSIQKLHHFATCDTRWDILWLCCTEC